MTDELISRLVDDLRPVGAGTVARRLAQGLIPSMTISAALVAALLGPRPDLVQAAGTTMFWIKLAYSLALALLALWVALALARPVGRARVRALWLASPVVLILLLAAWSLMVAPPEARTSMIMGGSAALCPWLIVGFALPPLAGLIWAMRGLAPTRPRQAGGAIGLAAGAISAFIYAVHCNETAVAFLAIWYSLGILASGLLGAILGPRLLRW